MSDQHGWVLMDAVWSSVVVVLAFMATFMALENGNKTATKDVVKTSAYDVAQNELNGLRELGVQNINSLLAKNNASNAPTSPSKTVMLGGEQYKIWYKAYYVSGLGDNSLDACGGTFVDDGSGAAKYIYMKVTVQYPGITFSGSTPSSPLPTLDAYFSPEGGDTNANTGTLRVYTLNSTNVPYVGTTVSLEATGVGMNYSTVTKTTGSTGCALFTGLPRGSYNINVSTGLYDLYMNNPTGGTDVTPINLPARAAMSRDIHLENAVRVTPDVYTDTGIKVNPGATTTSDLIGEGSAAVPVNWIARSSKIIQTSGEDFTTLPGSSY
ncbi:MAG: carboxypeptidase-like regulatory domain-containing protein, partial [Solirubrobacterales bacterium]